MIAINMRFKACVLTGALLLTMIPAPAKADNNSTAKVTGHITGQDFCFSAGVQAAINETVVQNDKNEMLASDVKENETPVVAEPEQEEVQEEAPVSEYAGIAISQVELYLNIRAEANAEAEVLGKLYNNSAATVLETLDGWYKITSGSVTGYVSADYVVVGNEELCKSVSQRVGTVTAEALKFRKEPSLEAGIHTLLAQGKEITILDESVPGWYQATNGNYTGYVSSDYVTVETRYSYAESKEEEAARLAAEAEARRQEEERLKQQQASAQAASKPAQTYNPPAGGDGQALADFACQFVGNPYVWGGESLTNGADCSGFVKAVYAQFGIELPRGSYALRSAGYAVSEAEMQPGDIVCYSGHVGIYIGDGKIVHASNKNDGIKISRYTYRTPVAIRRIF